MEALEELNDVNPSAQGEAVEQAAEQAAPQQPVETPVQEQAYLTRQELESILEEERQKLVRLAQEYGYRGGQSFADRLQSKLPDRRRFEEQLKMVQNVVQKLVQAGHLDESTAAGVLHDARWDALTNILPSDQEPMQVAPQMPQTPPQSPQPPPPEADPMRQEAVRAMRQRGLSPQDPEWRMADPMQFDNPVDWANAFAEALAAKERRMSRATPAPSQQPAKPSQAVDITSPGAPEANVTSLLEQLRVAQRRNDYEAVERLGREIDRALGIR